MNNSDSASPLVADEQHRKLALRVVFLTVFLDILGFGIVIPQLGVYSSKFGAEGWVIGVLGASYSIMQFLFAPFWGRLSDRIGRRPVLLLSIFGTASGYVLFAFSHSLVLLFAARLLDGFTGANISAAQAYVSDVTEPEDRARIFGLFGAIFGLGFVLGPAFGLLLSGLPGVWGGNLGVGLFTAALGYSNFLSALKFLPETLSKAQQAINEKKQRTGRSGGWNLVNARAFNHALRLPGLNLILVIAFVATFAFANRQVTYTPFLIVKYVRPSVQKYIREHPDEAVIEAKKNLSAHNTEQSIAEGADTAYSATLGGDFTLDRPQPDGLTWREVEKTLSSQRAVRLANALFVAIGLTAILVQGALLPLLRKRAREVSLLICGTIIMAAALALVPLPGAYLWQFPVSMLIALGNGLFMPVLSAMVSEYSPIAERGEIFGVYQSMQSLGRILGPVLGGALFEFISHGAPYFTGAAIMLGAVALAFRLRHYENRAQPALENEFCPEPVMEA
jgi:MFS family permease